jgi:hypothetical protein
MGQPRRFLVTAICAFILLFAAGQGCPSSSGTDSNRTIAVQFSVSAKVVTSVGSGVGAEPVSFDALKCRWNADEDRWDTLQDLTGSGISKSSGAVGTTDPWAFGYNLHKGETVFISATEQTSGNKQEIQYSYDQAAIAAGSDTSTTYEHQFTLDSGI